MAAANLTMVTGEYGYKEPSFTVDPPFEKWKIKLEPVSNDFYAKKLSLSRKYCDIIYFKNRGIMEGQR